MDLSFFMSSSDAAKHLWVQPAALRGGIEFTFNLKIKGLTTRLWPERYIVDFATHTRSKAHRSVAQTAKVYLTLPRVTMLMEEVQEEFEKRLTAHKTFTSQQVADVFCVSRMTVSNWREKGVMVPASDDNLPKRGQGSGRQVEYAFPQSELRRISQWHLPKA